jgi:hypothetical protein
MKKWFGIDGLIDHSGGWLRIGKYWFGWWRGKPWMLPVIQGGGKAVTVQNNVFAFGDDDGSESGHSLDTENANRTAQIADVTFMIRISVEENGGGLDDLPAALYCSYNSGTFTAVGTTASGTMPLKLANDTQSRSDDENTTERLTAGAGTWVAGKYDDGQTAVGCSAVTLSSNYTEFEFAIQIDSAYASNGDTFELRIEWTDGTDLDSYPGSYPTATADIGYAPLVAEYKSFTLTGQASGFLFTRLLTAAQGSFTLTGQAAGLLASRLLTADQGSFTLAGQAAGLLYSRIMAADQGSQRITNHLH